MAREIGSRLLAFRGAWLQQGVLALSRRFVMGILRVDSNATLTVVQQSRPTLLRLQSEADDGLLSSQIGDGWLVNR
jgi:hypothetical protein